ARAVDRDCARARRARRSVLCGHPREGAGGTESSVVIAMNVPNIPSQRRRDVMVAAACGVFVAAMVGAAYAAVPLYNWFCRTTGFGGTTQVATPAPSPVLLPNFNVPFNAN